MPKNIKIDTSKLTLLPVPRGLVMKYQHYYVPGPGAEIEIVDGVRRIIGVKRLDSTVAWLEDELGNNVCEADALVNPKDTPIKKLGRAIAHNRCIKKWNSRKEEKAMRLRQGQVYDVKPELPLVAMDVALLEHIAE